MERQIRRRPIMWKFHAFALSIMLRMKTINFWQLEEIRKQLCNVIWNVLCALFLTSLIRKHGDSLSRKFRAQVQAHRQSLYHCSVYIFTIFRDIHGLLRYSVVVYVCVWTYAKTVCVLFVSRIPGTIFNRFIHRQLAISEQQWPRPVFYVPAMCGGSRSQNDGTHITE